MPPNTTPEPGTSGPYTAENGQLQSAKPPSWWNPAWTTPGYWKSWAWLAALIGGFIPVILPDVLNWVISHADILIDFAFPTLDPLTKVLVLKVVVTAVLLLRPVKQSNMPAAVTPVAVVKVPDTVTVQGELADVVVDTVLAQRTDDAARFLAEHARRLARDTDRTHL